MFLNPIHSGDLEMSAADFEYFRNDLNPGEHLLWTGRPRQGIYLQVTDIFMIPFSLMWGGFAFFWEYMVLTKVPKTGHGLLFPLWGIPFCLAGIYIIIGRFFYGAYVRKNSYYAITNVRVLIKKFSLWGVQLITFELTNLPQLTVTTAANGLTTVEFGQRSYARGAPLPPKFEQIENGTRVAGLLRAK
jgi:hypothetical protein